MFTFGIFSTHLPYIAFVFFYAFFFLSGIQKASAGELSNDTSFIVAQTETTTIAGHTFKSDNPELSSYNITKIQLTAFNFIKGKKIKLYSHRNEKPGQLFFYSPLFSRPPPEN